MTITNPTYRYGIILNGASHAPGDPSVGSHVITLKTPEQIAAAALDAYAENLYPEEERAFRRNVDAGNWQSLIVDAIETDRAQRAEIHQDWRDDQENVMHHTNCPGASFPSKYVRRIERLY